jgi:hypothetical protein
MYVSLVSPILQFTRRLQYLDTKCLDQHIFLKTKIKKNTHTQKQKYFIELILLINVRSAPMVSPPYRGGGVWVLPRPWEICRR